MYMIKVINNLIFLSLSYCYNQLYQKLTFFNTYLISLFHGAMVMKMLQNLEELSFLFISSVQLLIHVWLFVTPWIAACQASLSITNSQNLPKLMSTESVMPSNHLILCHPLLLLPSTFPSIRVFSNESALRIRWPKYWSSSFNISPSNEHPGLISVRMDWLVLLAVQGTLKSLLQHHSSKASILWRSSFFTVQLSHPYMTTGKTIALTTRAFVEKVMSLLFNMAIFLNRAHIIKKDTWGILTLHGGWQSAFCTAMYKGIQCDSKNRVLVFKHLHLSSGRDKKMY